MIKLTEFQDGCLFGAVQKALEFNKVVVAGLTGGPFDVEEATLLLIEAIGCVAAGFDEDLDDAMLHRVIRSCGLASAMQGVPANDLHSGGDAA